jgi:phosphodiesterase/alkaline phosphatase D-like protein
LNTLPSAPVLLEPLSVASTEFTLRWNPVLRADQYQVDISTDSTFASFFTGYNSRQVGNVTQVEVTGATPLTRYFYRIRARNSSLNVTSVNSQRRSVTTPSRPPVVGVASSVSNSGFTANWQSVQGANQYFIDVALDENFTQFVSGYQNRSNGASTTLVLDNLLSAQNYFYRVRASNSNSGLTSENSDVVEVITLPDTPVAQAASGIESRSFTANWSSVERIDGYLLDVSTDSLFRTFIPEYRNRVVSSSQSIIIDELSPNTAYFYRVRGALIESNVIGGFSNSVRVITGLDAPENVVAIEVSPEEITFSWDDAENAEEYFIDLALDQQFVQIISGYEDLSVGNVTSITLDGLAPVETYYFRVRSSGRDNSISSAFSPTTIVNTIPQAPELNSASLVKAIGFTATWSAVDRASFYEFDLAYDDDFVQIYGTFNRANVGDVTEITLEDILPGTTLYYRVRALNSVLQVTSDWSIVQMVTTTPIDPVTSTVEVSKSQVLADGTDVSEIIVTIRDADSNALESVSVELTARSGDSEINVINSVTGVDGVTTFEVSNLKAEFVTYQATAIETELSTQPEIAFTPVSPSASAATQILASSFVANWDPVNGANSYRIDISQSASFSSFVDGYNDIEVESGTQLSVDGLFPGDEYFYRVRAVAPTGTSLNSNVISLVTLQADPALTAVDVAEQNILSDGTTKGSVIVTVRGTNGQPMFGVPVRLETSDTYSTIEIISSLTNEDGLAEFQVTSDFAGQVVYTVFAGRVEINTKAEINFVPLAPVANLPSLFGAVEFTSGWEKVNGATHYLIDVSRDSEFETLVTPYDALNVGDIDEYRVIGLAPGTTYFFRVRSATPTATSSSSNIISVTTYQIDLVNSTAIPSARKILANGEQKTEVEIKLINEDGDPLSDVSVQLIPDESIYTIENVQNITDTDGIAKFSISSIVAGEGEFTVSAGGLELESKVEIVFLFADGEIKLGYNFPNPFGSTTRIPVTVPERMNVTIDVYNSFGQRVAELESKEFLAGYYEVPFLPRGLSSGAYIVRMIADGKVLTQKMMYIK